MFPNANNFLRAAVVLAIVGVAWNYPLKQTATRFVLPESVEIPVNLGNLSQKLIEAGVIDLKKTPGGFREYLDKPKSQTLILTQDNSREILNLLWAFGLGNKNPILEKGPMMDPRYGGAQNFASTGGWTLARGDAMEHYSKHEFMVLTPQQQALVEEVSKNIYRPCCNNPAYFPDCNHGMAMLGLLELLAANNIAEKEMYRLALKVNSLWFPGTYETIAKYLARESVSLKEISPKEILGYNYSSASGYQNILRAVEASGGSGPSCGI